MSDLIEMTTAGQLHDFTPVCLHSDVLELESKIEQLQAQLAESEKLRIESIEAWSNKLDGAQAQIKQLDNLTEEQLTNAYLEGFKVSGEGFNGEYPFEGKGDEHVKQELRGSIHYYLKQIGFPKGDNKQ